METLGSALMVTGLVACATILVFTLTAVRNGIPPWLARIAGLPSRPPAAIDPGVQNAHDLIHSLRDRIEELERPGPAAAEEIGGGRVVGTMPWTSAFYIRAQDIRRTKEGRLWVPLSTFAFERTILGNIMVCKVPVKFVEPALRAFHATKSTCVLLGPVFSPEFVAAFTVATFRTARGIMIVPAALTAMGTVTGTEAAATIAASVEGRRRITY